MNTIYKFMASALIAATATVATAQNTTAAYFTNDYKFRHTMNPAYGNDQNYFSLPALGNFNVGVHGNFGVKDVIMDNPKYGNGSDDRFTTFMNPNISVSDALSGFSSGNNRFMQDLNIAIFSAGFKGFGGYNTVELNVHEFMGVSLPYELFEFAKNTGNNVYNIGDINASAQAYAELAFGHSRQITDQLRMGAKVKLLFGGARGDVAFKNMRADLSGTDKWTLSGQAEANVSLKGFTYKTEMKNYNEEGRGQYEQVTDVDVDGGGLGGFGMAFDFGGIYKINDDWTVSASITDLGFISWSNNMTAQSSGETFEFDGFHDVSVSRDYGGDKLSDKSDKIGDQFTDFAHLSDKGDTGGRTTGIGATLNLAGEYTLPSYRQMKFGALSTTHIRGKYTWTEGRLSANWEPLNWINGGVSLAANSFGASMGWILNIHPKAYNFYISMDQLLGSFSKNGIPLFTNSSVAIGMSVAW